MDRPADTDPVERGLKLGFNVLMLGAAGAGATSLLNMIAADAHDEERRVAQVSARRYDTPETLLNAIADAIIANPDDLHKPPRATDPVQKAFEELAYAASLHPEALVVVDDMPGALGHEMFGRMRDELWTLELQWLVAARRVDEPILLTPPADAFFETVHHLRALDSWQLVKLFSVRDPDGELTDEVQQLIASRTDGTVGRTLALARRAVQSKDPERDLSEDDLVQRVRAELGEPAARLIDELRHSSTVAGPGDDDLRRRLSWSRSRAYQVFGALEEAGYIISADDHTGQPGRPRKVYKIRDEQT